MSLLMYFESDEYDDDLVTVREILDAPRHDIVSITAIVLEISPAIEKLCCNGSTRWLQHVLLVDKTLRKVTLNLWGEFSGLLDGTEGKCVTVFDVKVDEFAGKRVLQSTGYTGVDKDQRSWSERELQAWFEDYGHKENFGELAVRL